MNKQTQILIASASVGVVLLAAGAWYLLKPKQPEETEPAPIVPKTTATAPGTGTAAPGLRPKPTGPVTPTVKGKGPNAGAKTVAGSPAPGRPAAATPNRDPFAASPGARRPGAPPAANGAAPANTPRYIAYGGRRKDPFYIDWRLPVPPPYAFEDIEPIRLASDYVPTPHTKPYEVREEPELRVSGILTGDGVFAILELPPGTAEKDPAVVVKPGSTVDINVGGQTKRTYRVVSITKDRVKLRSQVGNVIYTQDVPLSDVAVGTPIRAGGGLPGSSGAPGSFGPSGGPGRPGGFPGSGGPGGGGAGRSAD